jgi:WD40 repeat protein
MGQTVVQFNPVDGNYLAIANDKKNLLLWNIKNNGAEKTLALNAPVTSLQWNQVASRVMASAGNHLVLIDPKDGKIAAVDKVPSKWSFSHPVVSGTYAELPHLVLAVTQDGQTHILDVITGKTVESFPGGTLSAILPKGKLFMIGKDAITQSPVLVINHIAVPGSSAPIQGLALTNGGTHAVTASADGSARVWNLGSGAMEREIKGPGPWTTLVAAANGQLLCLAVDKQIKFYSSGDGKEVKTIALPSKITSMTLRGNDLLAGGEDGLISTLSINYAPGQPITDAFGKVVGSYKQLTSVTSLAATANSPIVYSTSADKSIAAWKSSGDGPSRNMTGHANLVDAVIYSPDGKTMVSCSHDGTVRFWNSSDGKQAGEVKLNPQPLYCLAFRPDGKQLAVGSFDRVIRLIDVAGKKVEREIKGYDEKSAPNGHFDAVYAVAYLSNEQLFSAGADGRIKLWNVADGGMLKTLIDPALKDKAQRDFINNIKLSKDGKKLIAVGNGGWITIWNTPDAKLLQSQKLPVGLYGLSISPDDSKLATGNMNGTVYVIKMP